MREWRDIHAQISEILKEYGLRDKKAKVSNERIRQGSLSETSITADSPLYGAIHKSILSGFLSNIAMKKEQNIFSSCKRKRSNDLSRINFVQQCKIMGGSIRNDRDIAAFCQNMR